jgi:hypothetical protein
MDSTPHNGVDTIGEVTLPVSVPHRYHRRNETHAPAFGPTEKASGQ